jgi:hypothetical protein
VIRDVTISARWYGSSRAHGEPPAASADPNAIVVHENAAYLIDDRRDALHARIVALAPDPLALLSADHDALLAIEARRRTSARGARRALARDRVDHARTCRRRLARRAAPVAAAG